MEEKIKDIDITTIKTREELREVCHIQEGQDVYGFFASPAGHSLSPTMYNIAFEGLGINSRYFAFEVREGAIEDAVEVARFLGIKGFNVSMPHKQKVMEYLDVIDETASICNAVNTVVNRDNELTGYNTDVDGVIGAIDELGVSAKDANCVLLGLGGAGKATLTALGMSGASHVSVFVRSNKEREHIEFAKKISERFQGTSIRVCDLENKELLKERLDDSSILINCTSVGMGEHEGKSLIPNASYLHNDLYVLEAIYSPRQTELLNQAKAAGCKRYANGLTMLIHQGSTAFKLYTDQDMPIDLVRDAITK